MWITVVVIVVWWGAIGVSCGSVGVSSVIVLLVISGIVLVEAVVV